MSGNLIGTASIVKVQAAHKICRRYYSPLKCKTMVEVLSGFPDHVAAFRAFGKVTGHDYDKVINPQVAKIYKEKGKINFLYLIETPLSEFSAGAWFKDAVLGFVYLTEFRRIAIVSDNQGVKRFTNIFGNFVPGKFRGYIHDDYDEAKIWVSK